MAELKTSDLREFIGLAAMISTYSHPIDLIKVRIQLGQGSAFTVIKNILKNEGICAFYKGFSTGMLRHTIILIEKASKANDGKYPPNYQIALCSLTANSMSAFVSSPPELALIRMQADATLPTAQRRNYTNVFQALYRITAGEGVLSLWKGASPTVAKAMAMNTGMVAAFCSTKPYIYRSSRLFMGYVSRRPAVYASVAICTSAAISGFSAVACSLPFDNVKTQIQKMQPDAKGKYPYTSSLDCAMKIFKTGGLLKFYTGLPVYCVRLVPQVMFV